jgi:transcriptional regulator with PAS, ATPase and Fis domain
MHKQVKGLARSARQKLLSHHWPGNVRELRNVIERALILESTNEIQAANLPDFQLEAQLHKAGSPKMTGNETLDELLSNFERELIGAMLERNQFNLTRTAEQLKLSRHALRYRMQRLGLGTGTGDDDDKLLSAEKETTP